MADSTRDDLLSLTSDLSRELRESLSNMRRIVSANEQAEVSSNALTLAKSGETKIA
jgi:hypothetical protein